MGIKGSQRNYKPPTLFIDFEVLLNVFELWNFDNVLKPAHLWDTQYFWGFSTHNFVFPIYHLHHKKAYLH